VAAGSALAFYDLALVALLVLAVGRFYLGVVLLDVVAVELGGVGLEALAVVEGIVMRLEFTRLTVFHRGINKLFCELGVSFFALFEVAEQLRAGRPKRQQLVEESFLGIVFG
jgi:hypothetical protein